GGVPFRSSGGGRSPGDPAPSAPGLGIQPAPAHLSLVLVGSCAGRPLRRFSMGFDNKSSVPGSPEVTPIIDFEAVSKWYGHVIGLNHLTLQIPAGVTGLLGPNGAGKSTLLQLATGQLRPSQGQVRVLGQHTWNNAALNRDIGLCPEQDAFYEWMTGREFVHTCARLSGVSAGAARPQVDRTIELVGMTQNADRAIRG